MDRRTQYTIREIKEAFLSVTAQKGFALTTISAICKEAAIHRSTFYLHFSRKEDVLDLLLDEAFQQIKSMDALINESEENPACGIPLCVFIRENKKYKPLFSDISLQPYIIRKLGEYFKDGFNNAIQDKREVSKEDSETLFWFHILGCYHSTIQNLHLSPKEWDKKRKMIDRLIRNYISG